MPGGADFASMPDCAVEPFQGVVLSPPLHAASMDFAKGGGITWTENRKLVTCMAQTIGTQTRFDEGTPVAAQWP